MNGERTNVGFAFIMIVLIATLDAGLIMLKYVIDTDIISMSHIKISAELYLISVLIYAGIMTPILALCHFISRGSLKYFRTLAASVAVLLGYLLIYHKHNHVLRYYLSSNTALIISAFIFTLLVFIIWGSKRNRVWIRLFALMLLFSLILFIVPTRSNGSKGSNGANDSRTNTGPNVILLIVDAMRFDRLGCYHNDKGLTPTIDEIADNSLVYDNAYVHWPTSGTSHSSMLTARPVYDHGALNGMKLGREYLTMAEILKEKGYATGGFVQNKLLSYKNNYDQGFDVFITDGVPKFAGANLRVLVNHLLPVVVYYHLCERDRFTDEAMSWMKEKHGGKFFLFLQYFHPHIPYTPPEEYIVNKNYRGVIEGSLAQSRAIRNGEMQVNPEDMEYMVELYEGEIKYADEQIRLIKEYLEQAGLFDNTILLITADHGENLYEHERYFAHGNELYESTVHIPLVVSYPAGRLEPGRVKSVIRDVDFLPLVLELAEIHYDGLEHRPDLYRNPDLEILGITCNADQVLMYTIFGNHKYIVNVRTMQDELYDLDTDRHELVNLCADNPEICQEYRELVLTEIKENKMISDYIAESCIDEEHDKETEDLLRSLGYIQ